MILRPILCLLMVLATGLSSAADRTALVIGNRRYESRIGPLRNTVNDAKAVADVLRQIGFSVVEKHDIDRDELLEALAEFRRTLPGAEVGLFYFAGHGISVEASNYLIPIHSGFDPAGADAVTLRMLAETRLFNAEQAVADMSSAGARCSIVILDACRTTQLPAGGQTRNAVSGTGLAEMTPPAGSLIAFAADAGQTAFDGHGKNGLYTEELVKYLATPGLTIEQVFKRTRESVLERSEGGQLPAEYSRLVGNDIYLAGPMSVERAVAVNHPPAEPASEKTGILPGVQSSIDKLEHGATPDAIAATLNAILEDVRTELDAGSGPSTRVLSAAKTCSLVMETVTQKLPPNDPRRSKLSARALNRRGDALLILDKPREALACYNQALTFEPNDAYIFYNRGRAYLKLGSKAEARADFETVLDPKFDQPRARSLSQKALDRMTVSDR